MKKIIFCLSAILSLFLLFSLSANAEIEFSEEEAKELDTVSDTSFCECLGDCDSSGDVALDDARMALRGAIGLESLSAKQTVRADIDGNNKVDVFDSRSILRIATGKDEQPEHKTINIDIIPATCSTKGYSIKYCTVCQKKYSEWTGYNKKIHLGGWVTVTEATCKTDGVKQYKCQLCNKVMEEKVVSKSSSRHQYDSWVYPNGNNCKVDCERYRVCKICGKKQEDVRTASVHVMNKNYKPATCTENGVAKCYNCDYTETIKKTGHLYNSVNVTVYKQPTCTQTGSKANLCVNCGEPREGTIQEVPALGHSYDYSLKKIITEPTCKTEGKARVSCTECGQTLEYTLDKTEHTLIKEWKVTTPAECTKEGLKTAECKYCGEIKEVIPATGHSGEWTVTKKATCKEEGTKSFVCTKCGDTVVESIEKLEHTFPSSTSSKYFKVIREPNCMEEGIAEVTCMICGEKKTLHSAVDPDKHTRSTEERIISEATCQKGAQYSHYCTVCDKNYGYVRTGKPVEHKDGEWIITEAPGCTKAGSREKHCIYCDTLMDTETIDATGHINTTVTKGAYDINGVCRITEVCDKCGETVSETTFNKVVINGATVTFKADSTTTFKSGDTIKFTIEGISVDSVNVSCGIYNDSISDEEGTFKYTIPEGIKDSDVITFTVYTSYEED